MIHFCIKLFLVTTVCLCIYSIYLCMHRDGGLSTLCHSCGFACQQRVTKTFLGPGYLRSEDGVGSLTMAFTGKFIYMAHHFILLRLNPFDLRVDREGWWFEHFISQLLVSLSAEGTQNVSCPWLSPLQRWGSLTMAFTGKFVYTAHHSILLRLNPFDLRVDKEGWWFEHSISQLQVYLSAEAAKNISWTSLSLL